MIASENGRNKDEIKCVIEIHTRLESSSDSAGAGRNLERPGNTNKTSSLPYTRRTKRHTFTVGGSPEKPNRRMVSAAEKPWIQ
jgi:hypothetical protein